MDEQVANLIEQIEEEIRLHGAIHDLGLRKRDELVRLDMDAVARTNHEEQTVLAALAESAGARLRAQHELAVTLKVPEKEAKLRVVASHLPMPVRSKVFDLGLELQSVITKVNRVNRSNKELTKQSLQSIRDFFGVLTGSVSGDETYGRQGVGPKKPGNLMIDHVV